MDNFLYYGVVVSENYIGGWHVTEGYSSVVKSAQQTEEEATRTKAEIWAILRSSSKEEAGQDARYLIGIYPGQ